MSPPWMHQCMCHVPCTTTHSYSSRNCHHTYPKTDGLRYEKNITRSHQQQLIFMPYHARTGPR